MAFKILVLGLQTAHWTSKNLASRPWFYCWTYFIWTNSSSEAITLNGLHVRKSVTLTAEIGDAYNETQNIDLLEKWVFRVYRLKFVDKGICVSLSCKNCAGLFI